MIIKDSVASVLYKFLSLQNLVFSMACGEDIIFFPLTIFNISKDILKSRYDFYYKFCDKFCVKFSD